MPVNALVVGSLVMDLSFRVPKRPEPGEVIIAESFGSFRGGKGYNQAVAMARIGASVAMIGALGTDSYGDAFLSSLEREGIDATRMARFGESHTSVAVPLVTPDGDVGFVHAPGANALLRPEHCQDLPACDILLLQVEVPPETSLATGNAVRNAGGIVFLNPAPVHEITPDLLDQADIICANEVEALALLGDRAGVRDTIDHVRQLAGNSRTAVITLGARGAAFARGDINGIISPPTVQAVDATGAGDSFCAALAVAIVEGHELPVAVRFACAAGAHAATVRGAEPGLPTREDIERLLNR